MDNDKHKLLPVWDPLIKIMREAGWHYNDHTFSFDMYVWDKIVASCSYSLIWDAKHAGRLDKLLKALKRNAVNNTVDMVLEKL